jgi:hypothetical protein
MQILTNISLCPGRYIPLLSEVSTSSGFLFTADRPNNALHRFCDIPEQLATCGQRPTPPTAAHMLQVGGLGAGIRPAPWLQGLYEPCGLHLGLCTNRTEKAHVTKQVLQRGGWGGGSYASHLAMGSCRTPAADRCCHHATSGDGTHRLRAVTRHSHTPFCIPLLRSSERDLR